MILTHGRISERLLESLLYILAGTSRFVQRRMHRTGPQRVRLVKPRAFSRDIWTSLESDLSPYTASPGLNARAALVLAPHPDDEVFGCGGAIAGHVMGGVPVQVVILTDGALFGDSSVRFQECLSAAAVLGYGQPDFWALPDRGLTYSEALVQKVVDALKASGADLVYAPSPWEVHPDHRQTTQIAIEAVRRAGQTVRLAFYEVGVPLRPNLLIDITTHLAAKEAAMRCFASQLAQQDYVQHIQALNRYRTYTLPRTVAAAEAYWILSALELEHIQSGGLWLPVSPGVIADLSSPPQQLPLVSILIRSLDRAYLAQALDSIALQTYPSIEVVVVAALPDHANLPAACGAFSLRLLPTDTALPRSKAANTAIVAAKGELLLLLDDDDWLMPGHIARLVQVLQRQPHVWAAYTGIALVDSQGKAMGQAIDLPFDPVRQLAGNLTPIHAVMFRAAVLSQGCRFDETLDLYEDWDFWLQLSKLAPMVHLPGTSAVYRIHESSGVHARDGSADVAALAIQQRWAHGWTPQQLGQIMGRVWSHPELSANLNDSRRAVEDSQRSLSDARHTLAETRHGLTEARQQATDLSQKLAAADALMVQQGIAMSAQDTRLHAAQGHITELTAQLARQQQDNAMLLTSRSWRITRPLRWVGDLTRRARKA